MLINFWKKRKEELTFRKLVDGIAEELTQYYQQFNTTNQSVAMSDETQTMDLEEEVTTFNSKMSETCDTNRDILERSLCKVLTRWNDHTR